MKNEKRVASKQRTSQVSIELVSLMLDAGLLTKENFATVRAHRTPLSLLVLLDALFMVNNLNQGTFDFVMQEAESVKLLSSLAR